MLMCMLAGESSLFPVMSRSPRRRSLFGAGNKGAPPAIPPIIITPFSYQTPAPPIDPRKPPPTPPLLPPSRPAVSYV